MGNPVARGHSIATLVIGVIEIVLALIIIICSFVLSGKAKLSASLTPYWAGIPFIIPGILGVVVGITKNFCSMVAFMVLNIIVFVLQGISCILIAIVVSVYAAYASNGCYKRFGRCYCRSNNGSTIGLDVSICDTIKDVSVVLYVLVVFLVFAALITLAGSILGCVAVCCSNRQQPGVVIQQPMHQQQPMNQQQPPSYYQAEPKKQ